MQSMEDDWKLGRLRLSEQDEIYLARTLLIVLPKLTEIFDQAIRSIEEKYGIRTTDQNRKH